MAKFKLELSDQCNELVQQLTELGTQGNEVIKKAVYKGAGVVGDAIDARIPEDTGDMRRSFFLSKMKDENGYIYTETGFAGYDDRGVPNALKANAIESGTSKIPKKPFIRPAVNNSRAACVAAMEKELIDNINLILNNN